MRLSDKASLLCGLLLSVLFVLSLPGRTVAQEPSENQPEKSGFVEAEIITSAGDTLHGSVKNWTFSHTPRKIRFQESPTSEVVTFEPSDLRVVHGKNGQRIVSRTVMLDQVPVDPREASKYIKKGKTEMKKDTSFLEVIVDGPLTLYARLGKRDRYFIEATNEDKAVELIARERFIDVGNREYISTTKRYRDQIARRTEDCSRFNKNASNLDLELQSLRDHVASYNRCVVENEENLFVRKTPNQLGISFGVVAELGRRHHTGTIPISPSLIIFSEDLLWTTGYSAGISVNLDWKSFYQWEGYGQVQLSRQKVKIPQSSIKQLFLQLEIGGRYYLIDKNTQPYLESGITFARDINTQIPDSFPDKHSFSAQQLKQFEFGPFFGAGVRMDNIIVGIRGGISKGLFGNVAVEAALHLGYQF